MSNKKKLKALVSKFRQWILDTYDEDDIKNNVVDDAGYEDWVTIEDYFGELLENNLLCELDKEDKVNLLYLIARNWDIGKMIAWMSPKSLQLSHEGNLEPEDFIELAKVLSELTEAEFDNAKIQFASSFKKFTSLTPEIEKILLKFYNVKDESIKRYALLTLGKLRYTGIHQLLEQSWQIDDEQHKIGCLSLIDEYLKDAALMKKYLKLVEDDQGDHISYFVARLKRNKNYM